MANTNLNDLATINLITDENPVQQISRKINILVVDDDEMIRDTIENTLYHFGYGVVTAANVANALEKMSSINFELALIDIQMPGENGIILLKKIVKQYPDMATIMISGSGEIETALKTIKMGAYDYIAKPFPLSVLESCIEQALLKRRLILENRNYQLKLERLVDERTLELKQALNDINKTYTITIKILGAALDLRDSETEKHCERVAIYVLKLAGAAGIRDEDLLRNIEWGAYLHDIGKIGVSDTILLKPGKLTEEEQLKIRTHPELGYQLLKKIPFLEGAAELVLCHHESYDGKGYHRGLKGKNIPLSARLFSVADTIDAMTSDRPYRKALSIKVVAKELKKLSGVQFDPDVVKAFLSFPEEEWEKDTY